MPSSWLTLRQFSRQYGLTARDLRRLLKTGAVTVLRPAGSVRNGWSVHDPGWSTEQRDRAVAGNWVGKELPPGVLYTTAEAAVVLGVSARRVVQLADAGKLGFAWSGFQRLYPYESVMRRIADLKGAKSTRLRHDLIAYGLRGKQKLLASQSDEMGFEQLLQAILELPPEKRQQRVDRLMAHYRRLRGRTSSTAAGASGASAKAGTEGPPSAAPPGSS